MKVTSFSIIKLTGAIGLCIALSGCASLGAGVKKAPCGPIAGMTDPCGNRVPINKQQTLKEILKKNNNFTVSETV